MLHATFCPFVVSSMPLIRSGAVSNRTRISAEKVSLSAFCMAARCSAGTSNVLRTTAGPEAVLRAAPRPSFALPSISRKRRVNTSPRRSSRLVVARSVSAFRAIANTSFWARRLMACFRLWASFLSVSCRLALRASAAFRASSRSPLDNGAKRRVELEVAVRDAEIKALAVKARTDAERARFESEARAREERERSEAAATAREAAQRAADEHVRELQARLDAERQKSAGTQQQAQIDALKAQIEEQTPPAHELTHPGRRVAEEEHAR